MYWKTLLRGNFSTFLPSGKKKTCSFYVMELCERRVSGNSSKKLLLLNPSCQQAPERWRTTAGLSALMPWCLIMQPPSGVFLKSPIYCDCARARHLMHILKFSNSPVETLTASGELFSPSKVHGVCVCIKKKILS